MKNPTLFNSHDASRFLQRNGVAFSMETPSSHMLARVDFWNNTRHALGVAFMELVIASSELLQKPLLKSSLSITPPNRP